MMATRREWNKRIKRYAVNAMLLSIDGHHSMNFGFWPEDKGDWIDAYGTGRSTPENGRWLISWFHDGILHKHEIETNTKRTAIRRMIDMAIEWESTTIGENHAPPIEEAE